MAEELTRSLAALADRGSRRGADSVLEEARAAMTWSLEPWWVRQPALVGVAVFLSTLTILGGSLGLGLALRRSGQEVGAERIQVPVNDATSESSVSFVLIAAIALVAAAVVLVLRSHVIQVRKELVMATTLDTPTASTELTRSVLKRDRRLVWTIVVLVIGLVALGTYVAFDQTSSPDTAATAEITDLYEEYVGSWIGPDTDRFLELTTDSYTFTSRGEVTSAESQTSTLSLVGGFESVELIGDLMVTSDGTSFYVAAVERIVFSSNEYVGVSALRMVESVSGLRVAEHSWVGGL